jgi:hypothetical protein
VVLHLFYYIDTGVTLYVLPEVYSLLAMSFISALGCLIFVFGATTNFVVFLFGHVVNGFPGALVLTVISSVSGYIGWGAYTCRMHAWWGACALIMLTSSSIMFTFSEIDMDTLYTHMGCSSSQIVQNNGKIEGGMTGKYQLVKPGAAPNASE